MTEKELEKIIRSIKDLKIQGNTNIAKVSAKAVLDYITNLKVANYNEFLTKVRHYCLEFANARPNEPLTYNAMSFILNDIDECQNQQQARIKVIERIESFFSYIDESYEIIRLNAVSLLKGYKVFMTHCHSSLARDVLIRIAEISSDIEVINTETRPLYQGRITATKLAEVGVKVTHIVDSAVASFLLDQRYTNPEVILVGSDGITIEGDLINKVGSLNLAIAAKAANIPFYVVTQSMKLDLRASKPELLEIEQRDPAEVWKEAPARVRVVNPAFDFVPAKYITGGYITEKGLIAPKEFRNLVNIDSSQEA
jgi:ribose 1,5-bisphosphate isomerase